MKKVLLGVLVLAALAAVIWQAQRRIAALAGTSKAGRPDAPVAVETQPIRRGMIRDVAVFTGTLMPESQFVVAPKAAGWVKDLLVDIGDSVRRNDVVAVLNDEEFRREVEQAGAELQVAKANAESGATDLELAQREYDRVMALREKQIASAAELDTASAAYSAAQAKLKVAQALVVQKEAALKAAELQLSYTQVQAFWEDGDPNRVVGERFVDEGTLVSINQPLVSILENNPLTAVVFVIERDYPKMRIGQEAMVTTDAYPGRVFAGAIRRIAPLLQESSRQARVEIEIANSDHLLKPGMFVRAQVEFASHDQAVLIPINALVRRAGKEGIFILENAPAQDQPAGSPQAGPQPVLRARFVPVTTGIVSGEVAEVTGPAISGMVVTLGNHLLEDGARVVLPESSGAAGGAPSLPSASEEKKRGQDALATKKQGGPR